TYEGFFKLRNLLMRTVFNIIVENYTYFGLDNLFSGSQLINSVSSASIATSMCTNYLFGEGTLPGEKADTAAREYYSKNLKSVIPRLPDKLMEMQDFKRIILATLSQDVWVSSMMYGKKYTDSTHGQNVVQVLHRYDDKFPQMPKNHKDEFELVYATVVSKTL
ncbi:MAG TPA: hypothetical protein VII94_02325, partial [Candidatus Saccharimonadales bacterium]